MSDHEGASRRATITLLAAGAGLSVASLYYNQPILETIAIELDASPAQIGFVPMLTQLGYALGILSFAPLGDKLERRRVILVKSVALTLALLGAALAPSFLWLCAASSLVGLFATIAQDFVPAAAAIAAPESRGKTVGTVMTGLLLGILLSRLASGAAAERFGWRAVFFGAAASIAALTATAFVRLPRFEPTTNASYLSLLGSMATLVRDVAPLRRAALGQALLSVAFSGFWSTLALALAAPPYRLGSTVAGAFGLAGAAGALVAPLAGSMSDMRGPLVVIRAGMLVVIASFAAMAAFGHSLVVLVVATVAFDLGVQASLISHQTIIYSLDPSARSRLNAVLVSAMFVGMSAGAAIASQTFAHYGFSGVATMCALAAFLALVARSLPERSTEMKR